jgi:anti-sigma B factor antagonist/stage II sporulation protein AA (anti-sigma F factor antagonist)
LSDPICIPAGAGKRRPLAVQGRKHTAKPVARAARRTGEHGGELQNIAAPRESAPSATTGRPRLPSRSGGIIAARQPSDCADPPVEARSQRTADLLVVTVAGRIDHSNADELQRALAPAVAEAGAAIVLDFAAVEYISSMGLRALMVAAKGVRARQGRIGIAALQPVVREIFDISRFDHVLEVYATVADAMASLSTPVAGAGGPAR